MSSRTLGIIIWLMMIVLGNIYEPSVGIASDAGRQAKQGLERPPYDNLPDLDTFELGTQDAYAFQAEYAIGVIPRRSTLGYLCKNAKHIVIARIYCPVEDPDDNSDGGPVRLGPIVRDVTLDPEVFLLGGKSLQRNDKFTVRMTSPRLRTQGQRVLVFLFPSMHVYAERELIFMDEGDADHIEEVVRGFIKHQHGDEYNEDAYFCFLHDLLNSPHPKIWMSAHTELLAIAESYGSSKLEKVMRNDDVDNLIRWYAEFLIRRQRGEFKRPPREPSAEEIEKYRTLMQSDDREEIRKGMRILSGYSHWYRANPDQWVDVALPLLEHPDWSIRLSIAQQLANTGVVAGVPVIIRDGLEHSEWVERSLSKQNLERMLGEEIDFDPRAPEDERKEQVEAFKQWWEENKHRYEYERD